MAHDAVTRVALVTGASRGIGRAIAEQLAELGCRVVVNYHQRREAAEETAEAIGRRGGEAHLVQANIAQSEDRQRLVRETLEHWGRLDMLVNNAGITSPGRRDLLEADEQAWDQVMATNLKGPFFLAQLAAREMIRCISDRSQSGGYLINITSVSSYAVSTDRADYCMAKAAMHLMTQIFAQRLAEYGIQVFEICPGVIASDMTAPVREKYDRLFRAGLTPIARWGNPDEVARAVAAVVQGAFPYSTGMRIDVDGGFHIRRL